MITIKVSGNCAKAECDKSTSGSVGAKCCFEFDESWDGLSKSAVFRAGDTVRVILLTNKEVYTVPWEVLSIPGYDLLIGVYGVGSSPVRVIPTNYANCGKIHPGAKKSGIYSAF